MKHKALTISQPWADLIRCGQKYVENRFWSTNYRGPLAIHAGKGTQYLAKEELAKYPTGAVVAIADLVACLELSKLRHLSPDTEIEDTRFTVGDIVGHKYAEGPFGWVLDNIREIEPITVPGKQGLWLWDCQQEIQFIQHVTRP